jgi:hypothetical protein
MARKAGKREILLVLPSHFNASTVTRMADPPNKMASVTVDELLGMAHDAYARARVSPDASTKQKLTRLADDYLKQAKDMRRGHADRFSKT